MTNSKFVRTAQDWHGGQSSALYQFGSTGIEDEKHAIWLLEEIDMCINIQQLEDPFGEYERKRLLDLADYVREHQMLLAELGGEGC